MADRSTFIDDSGETRLSGTIGAPDASASDVLTADGAGRASWTVAEAVRYPNIQMGALDWLSETYPIATGQDVSASASGDFRFGVVPLAAGDLCTYVLIRTTGGGVAVTLARAAIYSTSTLALLASTADQHALDWNTTTIYALPLSAPYTVPANGLYYVGALFVAGTGPAVFRTDGKALDSAVAPLNTIQLCGRQTGLANLPNPLVPGTGNLAHWYGVA